MNYRFFLIADNDISINKNDESNSYEFKSYLKFMNLDIQNDKYDIIDDNTVEIVTGYNYFGKGAQFSEIITINNNIYTFCDKTGIMFEIFENGKDIYTVVPKHVLTSGKNNYNPLKIEWCFKINSFLIIGSHGTVINNNIDRQTLCLMDFNKSNISYKTCPNFYEIIKENFNITANGYIIHECMLYDQINSYLYILPRKISENEFDDNIDPTLGNNKFLRCKIEFNNNSLEIGTEVDIKTVNSTNKSVLELITGFSSAKFVPDTNNTQIMAVKTREFDNKMESYLQIFTTDGEILYELNKLPGGNKYEGIEFIN